MLSLLDFDSRSVEVVVREQINARRDELEISPVVVEGHLFQCDEKSEKRMTDAVSYGSGQIKWMTADNVELSYSIDSLARILDLMLRARFERAALLHIRARELKAVLPDVTRLDLERAFQFAL